MKPRFRRTSHVRTSYHHLLFPSPSGGCLDVRGGFIWPIGLLVRTAGESFTMRLSTTRGFREREWLTPNTYDPNFSSLPGKAGIYLLVVRAVMLGQSKTIHRVAYVGMSLNLKKRADLTRHPVGRALGKWTDKIRDYKKHAMVGVCVYFRQVGSNLRATERAFIQKFNPPCNLIGRKKFP